ncbi:HipA N-terminal domain-containing protein [Pontibacter sp. G13]|uniref:HipA N-terminal domain-containing protein n=1 Tax=Pontibacter sp. G13 TaxID=3074898 RepID=UPI00288C4CA5|nr:HipA N-terminal domain-containing protein [Pontibacter sp. G13]WNJ16654.1 hypothetical protein RJD25_17450 [Pontibacter sp. G13]
MKIINWWNRVLKNQTHLDLRTPSSDQFIFHLKYKRLLIGVLELENGIWRYQYSDEFKEQDRIRPITNFPKLDKTYEAPELWPFFVARIPGLKQPKVQQIIQEEQIDPNNSAQLLKRFGESSINNPFKLVMG